MTKASPPPAAVEVVEEPAEVAQEATAETPAARPEGEDPWEVPCAVCGLLGCRRHT